MSTDVKLDQEDGSYLHLEARVVKAVCSDFMLDAPARHKAATPFRRALVHDESDGLTVNFAGDYPGGVTLNGVVSVTPHQQTLVVHGDISYEVEGLQVAHVPGAGFPGAGDRLVKVTVSVTQQVAELKNEIAALNARMTAVEKTK